MNQHRIIAMAAVCVLALAACKEESAPPVAAQPVLGDSADQVMFGMRSPLASAGIRRADMTADTAFIYDTGNRIELRNVDATFYTATGAKDATLTSNEGTYNARLQQLEGRGDVVIVSVDGRRLASPHLVYDQSRNEVSSDTNFVFTEPGRTLSGIGFVSDPNLRNLRVLSSYQGSVTTGATKR